MNDKQKLKLMKVGGVILTFLIILILSSIFINEISSGTFSPLLYVTLMPAVAIIALLIGMIVKRSKEVKAGLPLHDEMSQRLKERAGYIAYSITIYFILVLMWINFLIEDIETINLEPRFIIYGMLFFMLAVFGISWLIIKRKGIK
jgi:ABC-type transport system involved in multi-copper enzyme maturation permease subunit